MVPSNQPGIVPQIIDLADYVLSNIRLFAADDPDGDADQYRTVKMAMDWGQVRRHYSVAFALTFGVICGVVVWLAAR